jgi:transcriptional regulator with XRE-family HTH domain
MLLEMTARQRAESAGAADARRIVADIGREIAMARRAAGVSQRTIAARAGMAASHVGRLERGEIHHPSFETVCRCARAAGLVIHCRAYPDGTRVRDQASLALLARLDAVLGAPLRTRREVSLPRDGDQRAWDARIFGGDGSRSSVEAETHLFDMQAVGRRIELKQRDDPGAGAVILLLNRTAHNRRVMAEHRESFRGQFPLDGAAILRHLRAGRIPPASGILLL